MGLEVVINLGVECDRHCTSSPGDLGRSQDLLWHQAVEHGRISAPTADISAWSRRDFGFWSVFGPVWGRFWAGVGPESKISAQGGEYTWTISVPDIWDAPSTRPAIRFLQGGPGLVLPRSNGTRGCTLDGYKISKLLKDRKSVMLGVWGAPGDPGDPSKRWGGEAPHLLKESPGNPNFVFI
jgi:hypothetical protein